MTAAFRAGWALVAFAVLGCQQPRADPCPEGSLPEVCNGLDDDCDGETDEGFFGLAEECNGLDDNCNGAVDEGVFGVIGGPVELARPPYYVDIWSACASSGDRVAVAWTKEATDRDCWSNPDACPPIGVVLDQDLGFAVPPGSLMPPDRGPYLVGTYGPRSMIRKEGAFAVVGAAVLPGTSHRVHIVQEFGDGVWGPPVAIEPVRDDPSAPSVAWVDGLYAVLTGFSTRDSANANCYYPSAVLSLHDRSGGLVAPPTATPELCPGGGGFPYDREATAAGARFWLMCQSPETYRTCCDSPPPHSCPLELAPLDVAADGSVAVARVPPADLAQLDSAPSFHSAVSDADDVVLYADMREWDSADRIFASSFWSVRIGFDGGEPRVRSVREHPRGAQLTKGPRGYLGVQIPIDTSSGTHTTLDFWHRASPDEPPIATPTGTLPPSTAEGPDVPDVGCSAPLPDGSFVVIVAEGEWRDGALYQRDLVAWKVGCREPGPLP